MSTHAITKSRQKLEAFAASRERDKLAVEIAEREDIPFWEAYAKVLDAEEGK